MILAKGGNILNKENDDYTVEIKENFLSKVLNKFKHMKNQKLLTSGNVNIKYTGESISFLWFKAKVKARIIKNLDRISYAILKTKDISKNKYKAFIIGEDNNEENELESIEKKKLSDLAPIIPKTISKTISYNNLNKEETKEK